MLKCNILNVENNIITINPIKNKKMLKAFHLPGIYYKKKYLKFTKK